MILIYMGHGLTLCGFWGTTHHPLLAVPKLAHALSLLDKATSIIFAKVDFMFLHVLAFQGPQYTRLMMKQ